MAKLILQENLENVEFEFSSRVLGIAQEYSSSLACMMVATRHFGVIEYFKYIISLG